MAIFVFLYLIALSLTSRNYAVFNSAFRLLSFTEHNK